MLLETQFCFALLRNKNCLVINLGRTGESLQKPRCPPCPHISHHTPWTKCSRQLVDSPVPATAATPTSTRWPVPSPSPPASGSQALPDLPPPSPSPACYQPWNHHTGLGGHVLPFSPEGCYHLILSPEPGHRLLRSGPLFCWPLQLRTVAEDSASVAWNGMEHTLCGQSRHFSQSRLGLS